MDRPSTLETRREALRRQVATLRELPSPSRVLQEVWSVLEDPRASASSLAAILARDTALSARTLRLANCAYFGLRQPVTEVRSACVVLGFETVKGLAVGVATLDGLTAPAARVLDVNAFWLHSVAVATAAHSLARQIGLPDTGTAFCGGMMHDLGRLVLAVVRPADYGALLGQTGMEATREEEREAIGAGHDEVGGWAAERWRFPTALRDAITHHHVPAEGGGWRRWGAMIHVADTLAHRHGLSGGQPAAAPEPPAAVAPEGIEVGPDAGALALLGISPEAVAKLDASFAAELPGIRDLATAARGRS